MVTDMMRQLPKIYNAYREENATIKKLQTTQQWDYIISDHRYGVKTKSSKNYILCHQIQIQSNISLAKRLANFVHHYLLNQFDQVWIPDYPDNKMAGILSDTEGIQHYKFVGPLSRLLPTEADKQYDLLVILSGPEPARTIFENSLLPYLKNSNKKIVLIRGTIKNIDTNTDEITVVDFLHGTALNDMINASDTILSRAGYSSIMDYVALSKKAILVPTPGQTEQEYLASWHQQNDNFIIIHQSDLSKLESILRA